MKKALVILFSFGFVFTTTSAALAGYKRHHRYGHPYRGHYGSHGHYRYHYSPGRYWASWGAGVLTGAILSHVFYSPAPRTVVYTTPSTVVVPAAPAVVVKEPPPPPVKITVPSRVLVVVKALNVRQGPGFQHDVLTFVHQGAMLEVAGSAPGWLYVRTPSGQYGWVMRQYTNIPVSPQG